MRPTICTVLDWWEGPSLFGVECMLVRLSSTSGEGISGKSLVIAVECGLVDIHKSALEILWSEIGRLAVLKLEARLMCSLAPSC